RRISSRYCFMPQIPLALPRPDQVGTEQNHRYTDQLTDGQPAKGQIAATGVRLAEGRDEEAEGSVAHRKQPADTHGWPRLAGKQPEYDKQRDTFQRELIELRRMAGELLRVGGKHHGPGHVGRPAPELGIDEVADAP